MTGQRIGYAPVSSSTFLRISCVSDRTFIDRGLPVHASRTEQRGWLEPIERSNHNRAQLLFKLARRKVLLSGMASE